MTPPLAIGRPAPVPHPRGIFDLEGAFPGVSMFRIYDCAGVLLEQREVPADRVDGQVRASLEWTLEHHCPADEAKHAITCVSARHQRSSLKLMV
jgi:hypothetical protein